MIRRFCLFLCAAEHRTLGSEKNVGLGAGDWRAEDGGWIGSDRIVEGTAR